MKHLLLLVYIVSIPTATAWSVPAFPGADGYGRNSIGGRGGTVIQVTTLNDAGTGSLRAALGATGPRTVVFRVAGIIALSSQITINNPFVTIAGQTAPGDGICIRFAPNGTAACALNIATHDVIIRHIRIRCGFSQGALDFGSPFKIAYADDNQVMNNIILDHCSSSWHPGRTGVTIWPEAGSSTRDITIQRHIASEALLGGNVPNGARGAFLFGSGTSTTTDGYIDNITLYKSLMAQNRKRHPEAKSNQTDASHHITDYQIINNVIYSFDYEGSVLIGNENNPTSYHISDEEVCHYNIFGNFYKRSETGNTNQSELCITPGVRVYAGDNTHGNIGPGRTVGTQDPWNIVSLINWNIPDATTYQLHAPATPYRVSSPFDSVNLPSYQTAQSAYTDVLGDVGANKGLNADGTFRSVIDAVDARIINDVKNNSGTRINDPADVGGWPAYNSGGGPYADTDLDGMSDSWETARFSTVNRNGKGDLDNDGYMDLEEFLNGTDPTGGMTGIDPGNKSLPKKPMPESVKAVRYSLAGKKINPVDRATGITLVRRTVQVEK